MTNRVGLREQRDIAREKRAEANGGFYIDKGYVEGEGTPLWDVVDGDWTKPQPKNQIEFMLAKSVWKCSACRFAGARPGLTAAHWHSIREHENAEVRISKDAFGNPKFRCSACKVETESGSETVERHIRSVIEIDHTNAIEEIVNRFVRQKPLVTETPIDNIVAFTNKTTVGVSVPEDIQVNGDAPRPARRRRHRSRGKARHGSKG